MISFKQGYKVNQLTNNLGPTWLFLPGGPGLGSEYLTQFCQKLKLPGSILLLDFPKDGINSQGQLNIGYWQEGLINLLKSYKQPILVTHSFAGMFSLNLPEIQSYIGGLILMNTTPENSFINHIKLMQNLQGLPDLAPAVMAYHLNPTDQNYRDFWQTYKHYCFTKEEIPKGTLLMNDFTFNSAAYYETILNFYPVFTCKWYPTLIPAMTIASENDYICPAGVFINDPHFQSSNIINKLISRAGHFPWLLHHEKVHECFNDFIRFLGKNA